MEIALPNRRATIRLARAIAGGLVEGDLVVLDGGLGAGKTFLARALLRALGLPEAIAVPSPTFTLMNEYPRSLGLRVPILHADLYRIPPEGADDAIADLGLRPRRADGWALLVEWGAPHVGVLGGEGVRVSISMEGGRTARVDSFGARGHALLQGMEKALEGVKIDEGA